MTVTADCRQVAGKRAFHLYLAYLLEFPGWYGQNLDALYDLLTERARPLHLQLLPPAKGTELDGIWMQLRQVLADAAAENPNFTWEEI